MALEQRRRTLHLVDPEDQKHMDRIELQQRVLLMHGHESQFHIDAWNKRHGPEIHAIAMDAELESGIIGAGYYCHIDERPPPFISKLARFRSRLLTVFPFLQ